MTDSQPMTDSPLMRATTIRARSNAITRWVEAGHSAHWTIERERLAGAADEIVAITLRRFPQLGVPGHSRWRHFEVGQVDRARELVETMASRGHGSSSIDMLLARIDLVVISVLLDAGAGPQWQYRDRQGQIHARSEGLAIATIEAFMRGELAEGSAASPRVDAAALERLDAETLARLFQHSAANPLEGLSGRLSIMQRLGRALLERGLTRPAELYLPLLEGADPSLPDVDQLSGATAPGGRSASGRRPQVSAARLLHTTVTGLAPVWLQAGEAPDGSRGDLWQHPAARDPDAAPSPGDTQGWVPFHKLSQWLCYSLLEPLDEAGFEIGERSALTGLPEYRNGGLLFDTGVLCLREPDLAREIWAPGDALVVEWRALTVSLIDDLAELVRIRLGLDEARLPLASILEGGTWAAGRALAQRLRDGRPPINVDTGGSVF